MRQPVEKARGLQPGKDGSFPAGLNSDAHALRVTLGDDQLRLREDQRTANEWLACR